MRLDKRTNSSLKRAGAASIIVVVLFSLGIIKALYFYHPVNHIKSPAFVGSKECATKRYTIGDNISASCINSNMIIPYHMAVFSYGWQAGRAGRDYYRVGDDAYQIRCDYDNPSSCEVVMTQYNAFGR